MNQTPAIQSTAIYFSDSTILTIYMDKIIRWNQYKNLV